MDIERFNNHKVEQPESLYETLLTADERQLVLLEDVEDCNNLLGSANKFTAINECLHSYSYVMFANILTPN